MKVTFDEKMVRARFSFAERRLNELLNLFNRDISNRNRQELQQLSQEFFFHLVGARDILGQLVNQKCNLELQAEKLHVWEVAKKLCDSNPIKPILTSLTPDTRGKPLPSDPYGDDGLIFRAVVYRNVITHQHIFRLGHQWDSFDGKIEQSLILDPREDVVKHSKKPIVEELKGIYSIFKSKADEIVEALNCPIPSPQDTRNYPHNPPQGSTNAQS